jgi:hypothetical protein
MIAFGPFTTIQLAHEITAGQTLIGGPADDNGAIVMLIAGVLVFLVAVTIVKGVLGLMARLAEMAVAVGGTIMVAGLLGAAGLALFLLNVVGMGPLN